MIHNKKILAIIPARGGSKGVLRKNIKDLSGKPLIQWTIEAAKNSLYIDTLYVSSDDEEILTFAAQMGSKYPLRRPDFLAQDNTSGIDVVEHIIKTVDPHDILVLLQPTSPLRETKNIEEALDLFINRDKSIDTCVSVCESSKSPHWMYQVQANGTVKPILDSTKIYSCRQEIPKSYVLNGAIYIAEVEWFKKHKTFLTDNTLAYVMPADKSIDIDTNLDFVVAEAIMNFQKSKDAQL